MKNFGSAAWDVGAPLVLAASGGLALLAVFELVDSLAPPPVVTPVKQRQGPVRMRLFANGRKIQRPFPVVVYIKNSELGDQVFLHVPPGLALVKGQSPARFVPPRGREGYAQVVWKLIA